MADMMKAGVVTTILSVIVIMMITFWMLPLVYGVDVNSYPAWAEYTCLFTNRIN